MLIGGGPLRISEKYRGDGGISDTRTTHRLYLSITREHIDHVSGSRESRPSLIVLVDLWREKHRVWQVQDELD